MGIVECIFFDQSGKGIIGEVVWSDLVWSCLACVQEQVFLLPLPISFSLCFVLSLHVFTNYFICTSGFFFFLLQHPLLDLLGQ